MSERVLVTGGAGFIGSHLVRELLTRGCRVRVLDNFSAGSRENLDAVLDDIECVVGDIRSIDTCRSACRGVDRVFHLAAMGSVPRSVEDPISTHTANVDGTLNILLAARDSGAQRVVFSSSSSVYGETPILPKVEEMRPLPLSPYAVSKLAGETYCQSFWHAYGLETVALRYFNVFGPRQSPKSAYAAVIPRFLAKIQAGQQPEIFGDGLQTRDFTYVTNVVQANIRASVAVGVAGEVFNIACGRRSTLRDVYYSLAGLMNYDLPPVLLPGRVGDVRHSLADITAAVTKLGYRPEVQLEDGLAATVQWVRGVQEKPRREVEMAGVA